MVHHSHGSRRLVRKDGGLPGPLGGIVAESATGAPPVPCHVSAAAGRGVSALYRRPPARSKRAATAGEVSSRRASAAIQRADFEPCSRMRSAASIARPLRWRSRFPIWRSAQFTAFRTKLRSSQASRSQRGKKRSNAPSGAFLSRTVSAHMSTKPARLTNSSSPPVHSSALLQARGVRPSSSPHNWSHTSHESMSSTQASAWVLDIDSWDVCDQLCGELLGRTPLAWSKAEEWTGGDEEFVKRAGFVLMCALTVRDKKAPDGAFERFLPLCEREAWDDRNFVRKAVNWALRQIGKRDRHLNGLAIEAAERIREQGSKSARWIAADALRELTSPAVAARFDRAGGRR